MIHVHRVYDVATAPPGARFLVDRLWPRGIKKEALGLAGWLKDAAPSAALRGWFGHDPAKWEGFRERYEAELRSRPESWRPLLDASRHGDVVLLYAAKDTEHSNAVALRHFLETQLSHTGAG